VATISEEEEDRVVAAAVGDAPRVLDCGCGHGRIARALAGRTVDGIELSGEAADVARTVCRRVVTGSVTEELTWAALGEERYEAILFCHVLEHLTEPLVALNLAVQRLANRGCVVIVLPNVATWRMRWHLLSGRWEYADEGILDRTHVKFYTLKSARDFIAGAGLVVREEKLLVSPPAGNAFRQLLVRRFRSLSDAATAQAFLFVTELASAR
jgi:2-polyprenyl-3-methyl-5-hydroxy-6-metoxy-1,4-benzoquinol methylase